MEKLRFLREEYNLSQQKLADRFGLAQSQIHGYETGAYEPDIDMLKKFANFFETSIDFLVGNSDIRRKIEAVEKYELNVEEGNLIDNFRKLPLNARDGIILMTNIINDISENK